MKNFCKRTLCTILILCSFSFVCIPSAAESSEQSPMSSDIALDTTALQYGPAWYQPAGYPSYRVWVENTTNYIMTVKITKPNGLTTTFLVPAGGNNRYVSNNATTGAHELTFSTTGNVVSGTVRVRISTMPLT